MNDFAAIARMLENLIRFGTIAEVQMVPPRVRVKTGDLLTGWLPWLALRAGADVDWDPPTVNEQVLLLSPSGQLANGVVVTGVYCNAIPANGDRGGLHRRTYRDGTVIEYDSNAHHLKRTPKPAHSPATRGRRMNTFTAIDLSQLPAPQVVEQIDYEQILEERKAYAISLWPEDQQGMLIELGRRARIPSKWRRIQRSYATGRIRPIAGY
ncbi:phage baseplate assembly protein V [Pseudomonas sp. 10B1]|uniref:phage baseplate assembly protein V n=1 Tax=unclassified Pseudomonas TaxID=196821 RepID=UPI002AB378D7|nr:MULTISPECIES: phage baseplate assembly protein V [unclassified Pseudomonas]MDY7559741.1 phage baseplate assembly protein V [Pseudomonas sp. AB6]MEA9993023.1 phage baseplate assembly protein V [Pseudomonas sp. AA4]MEB0085965.1 phage baseplate assembly protein V [Pseudomonas sp. RTI1]MEB0125599.1 phage baseplate assembly protein V [Pseudomonas sp. CCC1.2]MEB0151608.1 phage baseplate assembly protein V [Pseudomonas sp. CCC4.3]